MYHRSSFLYRTFSGETSPRLEPARGLGEQMAGNLALEEYRGLLHHFFSKKGIASAGMTSRTLFWYLLRMRCWKNSGSGRL